MTIRSWRMLVSVGASQSSDPSVTRLLDPENETEVSFFSRNAYENFKLSPEVRYLLISRSFNPSLLSGSMGCYLITRDAYLPTVSQEVL